MWLGNSGQICLPWLGQISCFIIHIREDITGIIYRIDLNYMDFVNKNSVHFISITHGIVLWSNKIIRNIFNHQLFLIIKYLFTRYDISTFSSILEIRRFDVTTRESCPLFWVSLHFHLIFGCAHFRIITYPVINRNVDEGLANLVLNLGMGLCFYSFMRL